MNRSGAQLLGRRDRAAKLADTLRLLSLCEHLPQRPYLVVLNYHRIGYADQTQYDPGVFSATPEDFDAQLEYLKNHFQVFRLDDVEEYLSNPCAEARTAFLITFDDGYLDNYEWAFPILKKHGLSATFFLPTSFIGSNKIPWWDGIGNAIWSTSNKKLRFRYPEEAELDLEQLGRREATRQVCNLYKAPATRDPDRFLRELADVCGVPWRSEGDLLFINWEQAAEMKRGGMSIGSHTHEHKVLSKLALDAQRAELEKSRDLIHERLGSAPVAFAYPVGIAGSYTPEVFPVVESTGYRVAFSFCGGLNLPGQTNRFDIHRLGIGPAHWDGRFRIATTTASIAGSTYFF